MGEYQEGSYECPHEGNHKSPHTGSERTGVLGETLFRGTCVQVVGACTELVIAAVAGLKDEAKRM